MVTDNSKRLIKTFLEKLNSDDKKEVLKFMKEYNESLSDDSKRLILEDRMFGQLKTLGPVSSGACPMCGR